MDNDQARLILACRRPHGADDAEPAVREALEQARLDPGLARWLEQESALDAALTEGLARVPVPRSLKSELLAGEKLVRPAVWWRRRAFHALAATLAVAAGLALHARGLLTRLDAPQLPAATFAEMRQDVSGLVSAGFVPGLYLSSMEEARSWIAARSAPEIGPLPPFLGAATVHACSVIEWRGRKVAGVCLMKDGREMHLFVLPRRLLDEVPRDGEILATRASGHSTLTWNSPDNVYVLVADVREDDLSTLPGG
jgi:hypothetical protein